MFVKLCGRAEESRNLSFEKHGKNALAVFDEFVLFCNLSIVLINVKLQLMNENIMKRR